MIYRHGRSRDRTASIIRNHLCETVVPQQVNLCQLRCGDTLRWVVRETPRSEVGNEDNLRAPPRIQDGLEGL